MSGTIPVLPNTLTALYIYDNQFSGDIGELIQKFYPTAIVDLYAAETKYG